MLTNEDAFQCQEDAGDEGKGAPNYDKKLGVWHSLERLHTQSARRLLAHYTTTDIHDSKRHVSSEASGRLLQ